MFATLETTNIATKFKSKEKEPDAHDMAILYFAVGKSARKTLRKFEILVCFVGGYKNNLFLRQPL